MTEKEVAELRRRFKGDKSGITHVKGCYVNENREIITEFDQPLALLGQEEGEMLLGNLRKTLSGALGKNLLDIEFDTRQLTEGEEHQLLMTLRDSELQDQEALNAFYQKVIPAVNLKGNYMILLAYDVYDVPYRSSDGGTCRDLSADVYRYILCSICPVKMTRAALSFLAQEKRFHHLRPDWVVSAPDQGFLFPAFDERNTNLYNALYYTRSTKEDRADFVHQVFRAKLPMPADAQKESFQSVLGDSLGEDCSYQVVRAVHDGFCGMLEAHKTDKIEEPLKVSKDMVKQVLQTCGVEEQRMDAFDDCFSQVFGEGSLLPPQNLINAKRLEIRTPDVTIQVRSDRSDLVETRIIDGVRYILIRAEDGMEVNGVPVYIG